MSKNDFHQFETVMLEGLSELIFLDRYAMKDPEKKFQPGDVGVYTTKGSGIGGRQSEVVEVLRVLENGQLAVRLKSTGEEKVVERESVSRPLETSPSAMWDRMAHAIAVVEKPKKQAELRMKFRKLLDRFTFSPGGRINAMLGTGQELTAYNCFVIPMATNDSIQLTPDELTQIEELMKAGKFDEARALIRRGQSSKSQDSREAIIDTLKNMVNIMARGGGVGINLSTLRPARAYVKGVNGHSSGAVSWGSIFSSATGLVEQGGSRRGALMLILNDWHPDVLEFIASKNSPENITRLTEEWEPKFGGPLNLQAHGITNANISVGISDAFMEAVKNDGDWNLMFPDVDRIDREVYNREWDGNIWRWMEKGYPVRVYRTVKARVMFDFIVKSAWSSAEPGVVFIDRANKESNSWYYADIIATNPCGEEPLPAWGVCNLGHINLSRFAKGRIGEAEVDWDGLAEAVRYGVRFLDNVIDVTGYFDARNREQQLSERRVGLGTLGLGELLVRVGIPYGSEAVDFVSKLYRFIAVEAYKASIDLAEEKGAFPKFDYEKFIQSGFMKRLLPHLPQEYQEKLKRTGIRNVTLLTQAPTGSTGTMIGTSTGIEPYYSWVYWRKGRLGFTQINERIVEEYFQENPDKRPEIKEGDDRAKILKEVLPPYFRSAMDLSPEGHIMVQAAVQKWVDSAISKTANCPNSYSVEDTKRLYELAYDLGCKGVTIYRDGSRDEQVLGMAKADTSTETEAASERNAAKSDRPTVLSGSTVQARTPEGDYFITINQEDGQVAEVFINGGPPNAEARAFAEFAGRVVSIALRAGVPIEKIIKQGMQTSGGTPFFGAIPKEGHMASFRNIPHYISALLASESATLVPESNGSQDRCMECGEVGTLIREEGCLRCSKCGGSRCG